MPLLKDEIMARPTHARVVIRPDSGDFFAIICGNSTACDEHERKGLIECLWDIFGGTVNTKGYKVLDPHIGAIYGDGVTYDKMLSILNDSNEKDSHPVILYSVWVRKLINAIREIRSVLP
ncbi:nicotinate phosphoribosyltransferase [Actinobacillus pleuropneumoniae serovar 6 str. Femo]|nr:nicotinate phosphoribosyltransferase [Actinobacillus pleuropneumoniae serovar 6 str. Femo]